MRCLVSSSFVPGTEAARAALLPAEQAHVKKLMEQGILEAGYLAADRAHLWMGLQGESQDQVAEVRWRCRCRRRAFRSLACPGPSMSAV
jgi:hypothetical protein